MQEEKQMRNLLHEEVNAMLITVLLLIVLYLVRQHSLATRCFHCLLAVLFGLSIHTWLTFLLASGLIIFSVADWHERTVPFFTDRLRNRLPALDSCSPAEFANDQSFSGWLCVLCSGKWRTITRSQSQKPTRKDLEAQ